MYNYFLIFIFRGTIKTSLNILISIDEVHPTIVCPDDIVASTTNVTWPDPNVDDNVDTIPAVSCDHSTNFTFPVE